MTGLEKAKEAIARKREDGSLKKSEFNPLIRAKDDPNSRAKAINALCFQCFGGDIKSSQDKSWRQGVRECSAKDCAVYNFRPQ